MPLRYTRAMTSRKLLTAAAVVLLVSACTPAPAPPAPTLAVLASATTGLEATAALPPTDPPATASALRPTATETPAASSPTATPTTAASDTPAPTASDTPAPLPTETPQPPPTATAAPPTVTPSLTITPTITLTPSPTLTPTLDAGGFSALVDLAARITVQPPEVRYGPATATALWLLGDQLAATALAGQPTAAPQNPGSPIAIVPGEPIAQPGLGTLPPPLTGGAGCAAGSGGAVGTLLASDAALSAQLGCALGVPYSAAGAIQPFERGLMIYRPPQIAGTPGTIEALSADSRFTRYADTWVSGIDPDSAGLTPPPGLVEPIRGFGKVWRNDGALAARLGWALAGEQGITLTVQPFERGVAVFSPAHGITYLLVDDAPGAASGSWRQVTGGF